MPTLLLTTLVLCLAGSVLPYEDIELIQSCMQYLDEGLEQGNPQYNWDRLNKLEQALARSKPGKEGCHFQTSLVEAHVYSVTADSFKGLNLSSSAAKNKGRSMAKPKHAIRFPVELMQGIRAREEHKLICIYIHSPCIFLDEQNSSVLNNHILGAFLQNRTVTGLRRPVEIQFWHNMVLIQAQNLSQPVLESLTYISNVGCSISAAATFCTLLLCCFFRRWPKDTTTRIHMNLLAALFLLNGSFLLSKPLATSTEGLCQAAAALLHGSLLCSLAWMGAEAFHLYLLLVKVYNIYIQHYLLKLCLFAWGLPTLVVMAVLIFSGETYGRHVISTTDGYQNMNMCWLTSPLAHFVTLCYSGLILLFNTLMLAAVVVMLRRIKRQKGQARRDWATVLGLTCLLGTTWGLAFFSFGVLLVPQLYLFTILNSLQGLFICLWYITTYRRSRSSSDSSTSR